MMEVTEQHLIDEGILVPESEEVADTQVEEAPEEVTSEADTDTQDPPPDEVQDKEVVDAPEAEEQATLDTLSIDDQGRIQGLDDKTLIPLKGKDGETRWVPYHELNGGTMLKDKYDAWIESEKKPLEEAKQKFQEYEGWYKEDPLDFLVNQAKQVGLSVEFYDRDGNPVDVEQTRQAYLSQRPDPEVAAKDTALQEKEAAWMQERIGRLTAEARLDKTIDGRELTPAVIESAKELYSSMQERFDSKNADNGMIPALKLAIAMAREDKPSGKAHGKPASKPLNPARPKNPIDESDPLTKHLVDIGVIQYG